MRRWMAAPAVFAAAAALTLFADPPRAAAQNKPDEETFLTADGVRLKGLYHKAAPAAGDNAVKGDPVVVLLYPPGTGNSMKGPGDWEGLTDALTKKGFNVFRFDWRGHGKSTDIIDTDKFWDLTGKNPYTGHWNRRYVPGYNKLNPKNTITVKDVRTGYFPVYATDLAAARVHLDAKNDTGSPNTSSIYLIGSGDAATLGTMWMAGEWMRPASYPNVVQLGGLPEYRFVPQPINGGITTEAGKDIAGAIWLSASKPGVVDPRGPKDWAAKLAPRLRDNNPMLFLYGDKDATQGTDSKFFFDQVLVAKGSTPLQVKPLDQTFLSPVKTTLKGANLLGKNAETQVEDTIFKYLEARQKDRVAVVRRDRKFPDPYFVNLPSFGFASP